ncbi:uncharacterized protein LOC132307236 [Cornus florida]|uniref:uncharacterized protein LOC132307236 n=1 Tax=Cornus florida TaxID=4283 RepID=UPI0028A03A55|nr:uncharacterized protein LOC132307236 [Cornus florida]
MAFYGSNSYYGDAGEYHCTPYNTNNGYDIVPILDSISYNDYDFSDSKFIEHEPTDHHHGVYDPFLTQSQVNYCTYNFSEPKFLEYNPTPSSISYSDYEFSDSKFIEYEPIDHHRGAYDPFQTQSHVNNYCAYNFSEPKFLEYNPTPSATSYFYSQTQYLVSNSTLERVDTDYEEYDPTPYDGGYDIALTYGKSLPHSDEICYPRSALGANGLNGKKDSGEVLAKPPNGSKPEANGLNGKNDTGEVLAKPPNGSKPEANGLNGKNDAGEVLAKPPNGSKPSTGIEEEHKAFGGLDNGDEGQNEKILDSKLSEEKEGYVCDDNYPWSGYDYGVGNRRSEDNCYGCGYDNQVPQAPYGYGSDALDLCESLFGYWPCLYWEDRKRYGSREIGDGERKESLWNGAADYVFGGAYSNGEWRNGRGSNYGDVSYGYERHYQEEPLIGQVKSEESSLLQHFLIFEDYNN